MLKKMMLDCSELVGQSLTLVRKDGRTWSFHFNGGDLIATEEPWRLMTPQGIHVSSDDHFESFGLPDPIDAGLRVFGALSEFPIQNARRDPRTGDLLIEFPDGRTLQFLQLSSGYESWRLHLSAAEFICLGGGALAEFPRRVKASA